ncbi:MAG: hypothetical protein JWN45_3141 [Acidobacteriaceae bacterium]|nr:hypothetical protein [Acidobacteriaceae bacterium]
MPILFLTVGLASFVHAQNTAATPADSEAVKGADIAPDEDGGQVRILPVNSSGNKSLMGRAAAIKSPMQQSMFFGSTWADASVRGRERQLSDLLQQPAAASREDVRKSGIKAPVVSGRIQEEIADLTQVTPIADLQIQARLANWISSGAVAPPGRNTVYVIYLGPGVKSTLRSRVAGTDYRGYYNLIHLDNREVRYVVVPFDSNLEQQQATATALLLEAAIDPPAAIRD